MCINNCHLIRHHLQQHKWFLDEISFPLFTFFFSTQQSCPVPSSHLANHLSKPFLLRLSCQLQSANSSKINKTLLCYATLWNIFFSFLFKIPSLNHFSRSTPTSTKHQSHSLSFQSSFVVFCLIASTWSNLYLLTV